MSKNYLKEKIIDGKELLNHLEAKLNKEGDLSEKEWNILLSLGKWYTGKDLCNQFCLGVEDGKVIYTCDMFFDYFIYECKDEREERIFAKLKEWWG